VTELVSRAWLDAELERIWLGAESELRRLQQLGLRPANAELDAVFAARRAARTPDQGGPVPYSPGELAAAVDAVMARLAPLRRPAVDRLRGRLGLSYSDVGALLVIAAPSIDAALADVFAAVRGPAMTRRGVDVALVGQLLGCDRDRLLDLLALLDEHRPPIAKRLIQVAPAGDIYSSASYRAIQPTLDLIWLLTTAGGAASPSLGDQATIVHGASSWNDLVLDPSVRAWTAQLAQRFAGGGALPWLMLWGAAGCGKRSIAARLAAFANRPLLVVSPSTHDAAQLLDLVRRAVRDAAWLDAVLYLGPLGVDDLHERPATVAALEACRMPVILGFDAHRAPRVRTTRPLAEFSLPLPQAPVRLALWKRALAGATLAPGTDVDTIARGYKLTPGEILASVREVCAIAGPLPIDDALLRRVMERRLRNELGDVATRLTVATTWDDVILPPDAVGRVRELIARKHHEDCVYREWGLDHKIGYGKGVVALFSGPPGTGKTLLAGLIAQELGYELYQIDLSQVYSRWLGETEKALEKVFDQAERAHAVLLFDEADALFAKRTEVEDSHDRYANVAVNYLLQRLERYSGVAVLTTNKDTHLDEALRRRLSLHLRIEEPEAPDRLRLWQKHLPASIPGARNVDLAGLAEEFELTGGYIKNVAVRAAFLAAAEELPVTTERLRRAARLELEDLGRVVTWPTEPVLSRPRGALDHTHSDEHIDYIDG
jgi:AAA+ superfamily predicted ATPase